MTEGSRALSFRVETRNGVTETSLSPEQLIIAGWAGRDHEAVEAHIRELEELGVARPARTPIFYRVSSSLLTMRDTIQVIGGASSGEVEAVLFRSNAGVWVGVGSDHTDRNVETYGVGWSKQVCAKPVAGSIWPFEDVADHWDQLILRSFTGMDGERTLYQEGRLSTMLPPDALLRKLSDELDFENHSIAMFCGTLAALGEVGHADVFEIEIEDPVLDRSIRHSYKVEQLPNAG